MKESIIIGTRGSDLALWQAHYVKQQLAERGHTSELKIIKTQGDQIQHLGFDKMEGKGFFTKEIETALLNGDIDMAVHSHKDLETTQPAGLVIAGVSAREDARELLLIHPESTAENETLGIKKMSVVGTSSARRKSQLLHLRNDLKVADIRGNVPTRIQHLRDKKFDAILLAYAGVLRLGLDLTGLYVKVLPVDVIVPAPAQGALALQCREDNSQLVDVLGSISDLGTRVQIDIERSVLKGLHGGCQLPFGIFVEKKQNVFSAQVAFAHSWSEPLLQFEAEHTDGEKLVENILARIHAA